MVSVYLLIFLTDVVGLRPALAGLVIFISRQWDWINDPIVGHLSDSTHTRFGRRRPFLLYGAIPFGVLFVLLWWNAPIANPTLKAVFYAAVLVAYDTAATLTYMPYFALTPELTHDYDERTTLTAFRMGFSIFGSLVAFTLPTVLVPTYTPEHADSIFKTGVVFAVVGIFLLLVTFFGTRERSDIPIEKHPKLLSSFSAVFSNRPFLVSMGIHLFTWCAVDVLSGVMLYYLRYYLRRPEISNLVFGTLFATALLFLPFWTMFSKRKNKRLAYIIGIGFWMLVQLWIMILPTDTPVLTFIMMAFLAGIGVSAAHVLPWSIIPDAIEWDELRTGQRREGAYYSIVMMAQKAISGVVLLLIGVVLEWSGYVANQPMQPANALLAIRLFTGLGPALLLLCGIIFAALYPISREEHQKLRAQLKARQNTNDTI